MKNKVIAELERTKAELLSNIYNSEELLGHAVLSKSEEGVIQDEIDSYEEFNTDVENLLNSKEKILQLDSELKAKKEEIETQKELLSTTQKQLPLLYKQLGTALFENYTPVYADAFGQAYTNACIEELKITEAQTKEDNLREEAEKKNFFTKILSHAKVGVTKTQISTLQQKKDTIITQGAKVAGSSGLLETLLQKEQLDAEVKAAFLEFSAVNNEVTDLSTELEKLTTENAGIKKALDAEGVTFTVSKKVSSIDSQIEQKKVEQNEFSAKVGQEYATKYVSADGDKLVDFPKAVEDVLTILKTQKESVVVLNRSIEIEKTKIQIEKVQNEIASCNKTKDSNNEKIERLQTENTDLAKKIEEKQAQEKDLTNVLNSLQAL